MTYVIGKPCVDVLDRACVEECPVDCIYEGSRALYIHPDECVDCDACVPVCPNQAITAGDPVYVIDPLKCTECVGAKDEPQCKLVCPSDCIVGNPEFEETAEQLQEKYQALHG